MLFFSLSAVVVFNFALEFRTQIGREAAAGFLWVVILLAGTLGLNRTLRIERENHSLTAILIAPVDRSALYLGKVLSTTLFTVLLELILVVAFIVFFDRPFYRPPVIGILILGTIGYVAAGVLVSSITIQTRQQDVLLPVLLLPLTLPLIFPAATAMSALMLGTLPPWSEIQVPIAFVVTYDILMLVAGFLTYQYVIEA